MKRSQVALAILSLLLALAPPAKGEEIVLFSGLQASGTFGCANPDGTTGPCSLNGYNKASFQVTSTAGSVATVQLQQRNMANDPWVTIVTVINPGTTEIGYTGTAVGQVQVVVTWISGTLRGTLVRSL